MKLKAAVLSAFLATAAALHGEEGRFLTVDLKPYIEGHERVVDKKKGTKEKVPYRSAWRFRPETAFPQGETGLIEVAGVPFSIAPDAQGLWEAVDVGKSRWRSQEQDERTLTFYPGWARASAANGDLVLHLPRQTYFRAHVLAASVNDNGRDPVLTLRTGAFQNRGYLADVTASVPSLDARDAESAAAKIAGTFSGPAATKSQGRLFVVPVKVPIGELIKCLGVNQKSTATPPLDVQLTSRLRVKVSAPDPANFSMMPLELPSAVQVFAITFERSPVSLEVAGKSTWNIFPDARPADMDLTVTNMTAQPQEVQLSAEWYRAARDTTRVMQSQSWKVSLSPGEKRTLNHGPETQEFGRFNYAVTLSHATHGDLLAHHTTFARLPQFPAAPLDERTRSRFCVWWWNGTHTTQGGNVGVDAVDWLGLGFIHWFAGNKETAKLTAERGVRHYFADATLCLHEYNISGPQMMQYPTLMTGEPRYKLNEGEEARFQGTWKESIAKCKKTRAEKPGTEIIFGNSSFNGIDEFLYRKFPSELFDSLGHEACALMRMPERQPELAAVQEAYWFKRALEEYGYKQPLTGCAEGRYHATNPGNHSEQAQADLYVRDMLHDLAYGFSRICPACMDDVGNGYYWSNWGASGLVTRSPDVHPKRSYVAYAVAAHLLSDADFVRAVPTGSHSTYCLEFDRRRGDKVFACWTLRGRRSMTLRGKFTGTFRKRVSLTGPQGNVSELARTKGTVSFDVSPSPVFVEGIKSCREVELAPPVYAALPDVKRTPLSALDSLVGWKLIAEPNPVLDDGNFDLARQKGEYDVSPVADPERGGCLQFAYKRPTRRPPWVPSYQELALEKPIEIPGQPTSLGLYVRGNSGWGRVNLELRDAKGERWLSTGMPNAWNANDEQSVSYIIHDGWRWMEIPLPGHYAGGFHWPRFANWRHDDGDAIVDYPLQLTGLSVEQRGKIVYVTEMVETSKAPVRLSNLMAVYGDPEVVDDWEEPNIPSNRWGLYVER